MRSLQRAWRCLSRKRGKTALLASVLFLAGVLILGTTVVADAAAQAEAALAAQTQAKLVCEGTNATQPLSADDVENIIALDDVSSVNRHLEAVVTSEGFAPVTQSVSEAAANSQLRLIGYDDLAKDGPFADGSYTLSAGRLSLAEGDVLMSEALAAQNGLAIGDAVVLTDAAGTRHRLRIAGLFRTGNEDAQEADTLALARLENQLFASADAVAACSGGQMTGLSVTVKTPERLEALAAQVRTLLGTRADVTSADSLYQRLAAPLMQLGNVVQLMRAIVAVAAAAIVVLLLALWLRGRQQELAVYLSLGVSRRALLVQVQAECAVIALTAAALAAACVMLAAQCWGARLAEMLGMPLALQLHAGAVGMLLADEGIVVVCTVSAVMWSLLLRSPKTLLSRMEE